MRCRILFAVAVAGCLAVDANAAPLDSKNVAADAKWVMHVDVDALRDSRLGKFMQEQCLTKDDAKEKLKKVEEDTGVDLTHDLHGVTLYDTRFVKDSGVIIFHAAKMDSAKMVAKLKEKHADVESKQHGTHDVYTWTDPKGPKHNQKMSGAFFGQDRLLLSRDAKQLAAALDVLDGKAGALAADSPLAEAAAAGTFMIARGIDMDAEKTPFHLEAVRKSKRLAVAAGQSDKELFVDAKLAAPDAKMAAQVAQAVDGFKAILQLQLAEDKNADAVLHGLKAEVADATVTVHWRATGDDVAKLVAEEHERKEKRHAERQSENKKQVPSGDD